MTPSEYANLAQVFIAISIAVVWIFRFENIVKEFEEFGIPSLVRDAVGATKISLSTLLVTGVWYPELAAIPALAMAFLMVCAQLAHFKVSNPWHKHLPSLGLLGLSLYSAGVHLGLLEL